MEYIAVYKDKHYLINDSSQVGATLQAFILAQKDFGIESADSSDFHIIRPTEYLTIYGELLDFSNNTVSYNGRTYSLNDADYTQNIHCFLKRVCKAKIIYYYNGNRYEITKD